MIHNTRSVPKCMSCHKVIVVITGRTHCFHDCMYITPILLLWDLSTVCIMNHLWPLMLRSLLCLLSTFWFIGTSNVYTHIMCPSAWVATKPLAHWRVHCFHDCIYIMPILLLWDLSTLCVVDHLWPLMI